MISTMISRASAALLLAAGMTLLFAGDVLLPRLIPGFPVAGAWFGQLLAAAWIALAGLNWFSRSLLLGGIYGRSVTMANAVLYFVSAMSLLKIVARPDTPNAVALLAVPFCLLALVYGKLLFGGPFARDVALKKGTP